MSFLFHTTRPEETLALGAVIGACLTVGQVVGLDGPLAAGKTWIAKGIVQGIGRCDQALIKSPAYNLIHEYPLETAPWFICHMDFYRLPTLSPADALLFSEVLERTDAICLVEWASKFLGDLVPDYLSVTLAKTGTAGERTIQVKAHGASEQYVTLARRIHADAHAPA